MATSWVGWPYFGKFPIDACQAFSDRGSLAAPGAETTRYGGNTSTVEVCANDGTLLVLDAGTGIRRLAKQNSAGNRFGSTFFLHISTWITYRAWASLARSMTRVLMFTFGGQQAACSDSRLGFRDTYLRPVHLRDLPKVVCHEVPRPPI